jgi:hypothetical protein
MRTYKERMTPEQIEAKTSIKASKAVETTMSELIPLSAKEILAIATILKASRMGRRRLKIIMPQLKQFYKEAKPNAKPINQNIQKYSEKIGFELVKLTPQTRGLIMISSGFKQKFEPNEIQLLQNIRSWYGQDIKMRKFHNLVLTKELYEIRDDVYDGPRTMDNLHLRAGFEIEDEAAYDDSEAPDSYFLGSLELSRTEKGYETEV